MALILCRQDLGGANGRFPCGPGPVGVTKNKKKATQARAGASLGCARAGPAAPAAAAAPLPKIKIPVAPAAADAPGAEEAKAVTPSYGNQKSGPTTPVFGGSASTRKAKKTKLRKTRSTSAKDLATVFTRLWKAHAKKKKV